MSWKVSSSRCKYTGSLCRGWWKRSWLLHVLGIGFGGSVDGERRRTCNDLGVSVMCPPRRYEKSQENAKMIRCYTQAYQIFAFGVEGRSSTALALGTPSTPSTSAVLREFLFFCPGGEMTSVATALGSATGGVCSLRRRHRILVECPRIFCFVFFCGITRNPSTAGRVDTHAQAQFWVVQAAGAMEGLENQNHATGILRHLAPAFLQPHADADVRSCS